MPIQLDAASLIKSTPSSTGPALLSRHRRQIHGNKIFTVCVFNTEDRQPTLVLLCIEDSVQVGCSTIANPGLRYSPSFLHFFTCYRWVCRSSRHSRGHYGHSSLPKVHENVKAAQPEACAVCFAPSIAEVAGDPNGLAKADQ